MHNIALREIANGILLIIDTAFTIVLFRYIWYEILKQSKSWFDFYEIRMASLEAQIILALSVYHFGTTIRNGYNYLTYKLLSAGWDNHDAFLLHVQSHPVILAALIIAMVGGLCGIRVFSKHRGTWLVVGLFAVLAPTFAYYFFLPGGCEWKSGSGWGSYLSCLWSYLW